MKTIPSTSNELITWYGSLSAAGRLRSRRALGKPSLVLRYLHSDLDRKHDWVLCCLVVGVLTAAARSAYPTMASTETIPGARPTRPPLSPPSSSPGLDSTRVLSASAQRRKARRAAQQALCPRGGGASVFCQIHAAVVKMVDARGIAPHPHLFTTVDSLLEAYRTDCPDAVDPRAADPSLSMFRSSLGRIFCEPRTFRKRSGFLGLAGRGLAVVDVKEVWKEGLEKHGANLRGKAEASPDVAALRARRRILREEREKKGIVPGIGECALPGTFRYIDEFLRCKSAPELLRASLFPNGKEMAESMSAYNAVRDYLLVRLETEFMQFRPPKMGSLRADDPTVTAVVVGDGSTPRTAGLFAYRTQWKCVSIDPALKTSSNRPWAGIARLDERPQRVQDVRVEVDGPDSFVVLIMWHAHVSIADACACLVFDGEKWDVKNLELSRRNRRRVAVVSCACCNWEPHQRIMPDGTGPDAEYEDEHVPGSKRTLRVWQFSDCN